MYVPYRHYKVNILIRDVTVLGITFPYDYFVLDLLQVRAHLLGLVCILHSEKKMHVKTFCTAVDLVHLST